MKIFLNDDDPAYGYKKGWNTVYITDIFTSVPFYVRGNEFTRQLYHFADSIVGKDKGDMCTFKDGYYVQDIMDQLFIDCKKNAIIEL
jgi:hypothetical protein